MTEHIIYTPGYPIYIKLMSIMGAAAMSLVCRIHASGNQEVEIKMASLTITPKTHVRNLCFVSYNVSLCVSEGPGRPVVFVLPTSIPSHCVSKGSGFWKGKFPPKDKVRVPLNFKLQFLPGHFKLFVTKDQKPRKGVTIFGQGWNSNRQKKAVTLRQERIHLAPKWPQGVPWHFPTLS